MIKIDLKSHIFRINHMFHLISASTVVVSIQILRLSECLLESTSFKSCRHFSNNICHEMVDDYGEHLFRVLIAAIKNDTKFQTNSLL